MKQEAQLLLW